MINLIILLIWVAGLLYSIKTLIDSIATRRQSIARGTKDVMFWNIYIVTTIAATVLFTIAIGSILWS
jgi:uncharacterized membrane protein